MFQNTHDNQLVPVQPPVPTNEGRVRGLRFYVSGFAGSVTGLVMWAVHAPPLVAYPLVTSVAGLSGYITAVVEGRRLAKKRAAEERRLRRRAKEEAAAKQEPAKRTRPKKSGTKR